ncbi:hypothetical protein MESS4_710075 [Mesorhizobium sp. STM 4661]|nr:hypothetical protein MESS4_710075 [Mesorhizobium sp. STM 4661]
MEVARYVGDAAPNGKRFWRINPALGPQAFIEVATFSVHRTAQRKHWLTIPRQNGVGWGKSSRAAISGEGSGRRRC